MSLFLQRTPVRRTWRVEPDARRSPRVLRLAVPLLAAVALPFGLGGSAAGAADATPPSTPAGLTAGSVTQTGLHLSWQPSTDNVGVAGYRVLQDGTRIGQVATPGFGVTGLGCGTQHTFKVRAYDASHNLSKGASLTVVTAACSSGGQSGGSQPPTAPTGLAAASVTQTGLALSWQASTDDVGVVGYRVFQDGVQIAAPAAASAAVGGLACGTGYTFTVRAVDGDGNVSGPANLTVSTAACAGPAPCSGVAVSPGQDLAALAAARPAGTVFCLAPGTYRVTAGVKPQDGQQFIGTGPGVLITGGVRLTGFSQSGSLWAAGGVAKAPTFDSGSGFTSYLNPQAPYADDVTVDGHLLHKVGVKTGGKVYGGPLSAVGPAGYFVDYDAGTVYLGSDPTGHDVELAVAPDAFGSQAADVVLRNLNLNLFTVAGVDMGGSALGWTMDGLHVANGHDAGIKIGDGSTLSNSSISYGGRYGLNAHGADITVNGVDVSYSDAAGYRDGGTGGCVAAGGSKFVGTVNLVLENSNFHDNWCHGIWFDTDTYNSVVKNTSAVNNEEDGIRFEVSHKLVIANDTVTGNGTRGIDLSNVANADVYGNTVSGNGTGAIVLNWSGRTTPVSAWGSYAVSNVAVHDNTVTLTSASQVIGIYDKTGTGFAYSAAANNRFYANRYRLPDPAVKYFHDNGGMAWSGWQAAGMDTAGSLF